MDVTTGVVVLIFVISIFSGFGSNKGYTRPSASPKAPAAGPVFPVAHEAIDTGVALTPPPAGFAAVDPAAAPAAIKSYIMKYRSEELASEITGSIMRHAQTYDLNPKLAASLIARESKFNPRAVSSSGAMGLGQLLPSTAKGLGVENGFDIDQNARGTVRYIKSLVDRFSGDVSAALAGYLVGPNAVKRDGTISTHTRSYVEDIYRIYYKM
ncbi:MAG: lytic transglycosylase domain-containing protein [Candidatus Margulisbacteria bacterium]|jgi:soluble lytic murein transglycosylase-like protein|nr:lytic transglycosylase domain-containing protein [Candidatus Margulisiibacteriota bacterium]